MATKPNKPTVLELNALADLQDIARDLTGEFCIPDLREFQAEGIHMDLAVRALCFNDEAVQRNGFVKRMSTVIRAGGDLTERQIVTLANITREQLLGLKPNKGYLRDLGLDLNYEGRFRCSLCEEQFGHRKDWLEHRMKVHGWEPGHGSLDQAIVNPVSVLDQDEETGIDISTLHDGFYAIYDKRLAHTSTSGVRYLRVTRTRRVSEHVNKGYVWGKVVKGSEVLPVGTIKIRDVSGDKKYLIGYQRPEETYRGDYSDLLPRILRDPITWATLYSELRKKCMICGKGLTDEISCNDLIGPECVRKYGGYDYYEADPLAHFTPLSDTRSEMEVSATANRTGVSS